MARVGTVATSVGLLILSSSLGLHAQGRQAPVVTIGAFAVPGGWGLSSSDGEVITHELGTRLVESGRYRVLDSRWLERASDSKLPMSPAKLRAGARAAGVDYVIVGRLEKVTETYAVTRPSAYRPPTLGPRQTFPSAAAPRVTTRRVQSLRVVAEVLDVESGEVLMTTSARCARPKSSLSKVASLVLVPVSPVAAAATAVAGARSASSSSLDPSLERALSTVATELLRWNMAPRAPRQPDGRSHEGGRT